MKKSTLTIVKGIKSKGKNYITVNHYGSTRQTETALREIIELLTIQNELLRAQLKQPVIIHNYNEVNPGQKILINCPSTASNTVSI